MPFVKIALAEGKSAEYHQAISNGVHQAMVAALDIPVTDRFQVITTHQQSDIIYDPDYLGISRDDDIVFIQITMRTGRTVAQKKALYDAIKQELTISPGVKAGNIFVVITETSLENWSFGDGLAQYA